MTFSWSKWRDEIYQALANHANCIFFIWSVYSYFIDDSCPLRYNYNDYLQYSNILKCGLSNKHITNDRLKIGNYQLLN